MFSFFKKKTPQPTPAAVAAPPAPATPVDTSADDSSAATAAPTRQSWMERLKNGLRKTGSSIATVFTGTQIDDELYDIR